MGFQVGEGLAKQRRIWIRNQGGVVAAMNEAPGGITRAETPKYINLNITSSIPGSLQVQVELNKQYGDNRVQLI
jgi:hypothetical protein